MRQLSNRLSLTWRFALAACVVTLLLGFCLQWLLSQAFAGIALGDSRMEAHDAVATRVLNRLTPADLTTPFAGQHLQDFDSYIKASVLSNRTARVKIWNPQGEVIYSDDPAEIGHTFPTEGELSDALKGETASDVSTGTKQENVGEAKLGRLLEVYTPIVFPGSSQVAGAFEIYQYYAPVQNEISALEMRLGAGLGGGLVVLYLVLLGIVHGGSRTIDRQHRELEDSLEQQLRSEEERTRLAAIVDATTDFACIADAAGHILYLNRSARRVLGKAPDEPLSELELADLFPEMANLDLGAQEQSNTDNAWTSETMLLGSFGREIPVSQVTVVHRTPGGAVAFSSCIARDVTDRKRYEEQLVHLASYDPLTNLFNRRRFQEEVDRQLALARRFEQRGALLFIDLDLFKGINDAFGHQAGDELLVGLAARFKNQIRETDILARLGGDEFAVFAPQADQAQAEILAGRVLETVRHHTITSNRVTAGVTTSVGVALFPEHGSTTEDLLAHADFAMYRAKEQRDGLRLFSPEQDPTAAVTSHLTWERRLREVLEQDRFLLYAQPIRSLRDKRVHHEVLLRIQDDDGQIISPAIFLEVAERSGLIHAIDRWVVRESIHVLGRELNSPTPICLEVNLSGKAFTDEGLLPLIEEELASAHVDPTMIIFEITETAAIKDINQAERFIGRLKDLGCRFALDDFGVGFSSFYYLKHLPVDYLKIDGSFIRDLPQDLVDQHLVRAMVEVARGLGKETIAEFVGDEETLRLLIEFGVDYAQGYYVGTPRPIAEVLRAPAVMPGRNGRDTSSL